MEGRKGFIPLYRKFQNNILWKEKRIFSKAEAWIDILFEVQHEAEPESVRLTPPDEARAHIQEIMRRRNNHSNKRELRP